MGDLVSRERQIPVVEDANRRWDDIESVSDKIQQTLDLKKKHIETMERLTDQELETAELTLTIAHGRLRQKLEETVASVGSSNVLDESKGILGAMVHVMATPPTDTDAYRERLYLIFHEARKALGRKAKVIMRIQDSKEREAQIDQCISSIESSEGNSDRAGCFSWSPSSAVFHWTILCGT